MEGKGGLGTNNGSFFERYFFSKSRYPNAGLIRFALVGLCALQMFRAYRLLGKFASISPEVDALHEPSILIRLLHLPFPIQKEYLLPFAVFFYLVALLAMLGLFTRISLFIFSISLIYVLDIQAARGLFDHEYTLTSMALLALAFVPGVDNFSVDRLIKWRRQKKEGKKSFWSVMIGPPEYVWGIRLLLILAACTYFTSGLSKVRYGGIKWLDGQTLTYYLNGSASPYTPGEKPMLITTAEVTEKEKWKDGFGVYSYSYGNRQSKSFWRKIGMSLSANEKIMMFISTSVVLFEMFGFIILFNGWGKIFYLLGAIIMHRSIGMLMNLPFVSFQLLCFLLIDWHWVYLHLTPRMQTWLHKPIKKVKNLLSLT